MLNFNSKMREAIKKIPKFIEDEQILGVYGSTNVLGSPRIERQGKKCKTFPGVIDD